jgi:Domain of unknown function (DUF4375)
MSSNLECPDLDLILSVTDAYLDTYLKRGKDGLSKAERQILGVWLLDAEVNNGGFDQFFANGSGDLYADARDGLVRIGATESASIVRAAISEFPDETPAQNQSERTAQLNEIQASVHARFNPLDRQYYNSNEDVVSLLANYIRKNGPHAQSAV